MLLPEANERPVAAPRSMPERPTTASNTIVGGAVRPGRPEVAPVAVSVDSDSSIPALIGSGIAPREKATAQMLSCCAAIPGAVYMAAPAGRVVVDPVGADAGAEAVAVAVSVSPGWAQYPACTVVRSDQEASCGG